MRYALSDEQREHYFRQVEQLYADLPRSVSGFPANKNFGEMLEGLIGLTENDEARPLDESLELLSREPKARNALIWLLNRISTWGASPSRAGRRWPRPLPG